ncbi:hypothetical protein V6N12_030672 [Hibiscus sabdariffa]|uniref:Uncharacterized protein n=1 Tax=Hibiscus sabdariffa TaxID=183260 RepID=A0ABR2E6Q7_9ROSI
MAGKYKPFLAAIFLQVGYAGMDILSKAALNQERSEERVLVKKRGHDNSGNGMTVNDECIIAQTLVLALDKISFPAYPSCKKIGARNGLYLTAIFCPMISLD